jgi:DNA-binding NtrC family response regulator
MAEILIVDDDQSIAAAFERFLAHEGHGYAIASNAEEAFKLVGERGPDLVVMDIRMPGVDGLQTLQELRRRYPDVHVVMMTAYGTSQTSIDAIRAGAFEYLTKPLDLDQLRAVIQQVVTANESRRRRAAPGPAPDATGVKLVGDAPAMQQVYKMIGRLATLDVPALLLGERGTGKQLVAATIHENSMRAGQPFRTIDCAALGDGVRETDLVGGEPGTLHLASVHALSRPLQIALARALSDGRGRPASFQRVIASTDADLAAQAAGGSFDRDLYETLGLITLRLPPLRERREDIPLLVRHFLQLLSEELGRTITGVDDQVLARFREHGWPGNVRELEMVLRRACIIMRGDVVTLDDVADSLANQRFPARQELESALCRAVRTSLQERLVETAGRAGTSAYHDIVSLVEATLVKEGLTITGGNQVKAADLLGVNRATLRKKASGDP